MRKLLGGYSLILKTEARELILKVYWPAHYQLLVEFLKGVF